MPLDVASPPLTPEETCAAFARALRAVLAQLIAMGAIARVEPRSMLVSGEVALGSESWTMRFGGAGETAISRTSKATVVLRHVEGEWKLCIVSPWGMG